MSEGNICRYLKMLSTSVISTLCNTESLKISPEDTKWTLLSLYWWQALEGKILKLNWKLCFMDAHSILHPLMDTKVGQGKTTWVQIVWTSCLQLHCFTAQICFYYTALLTNVASTTVPIIIKLSWKKLQLIVYIYLQTCQ